MWEWIGALSPGDWANVAGTIVAALIGIGGLAVVLGVESHGRYEARLDDTLAAVIGALARRAQELEAWVVDEPLIIETQTRIAGLMRTRNPERARRELAPDGPPDVDLQAAVEVASLAARRGTDGACLAALRDATYILKRAIRPIQVDRAGRIGADIRRWRVREIDGIEFVRRMNQYREEAHASGDAYARLLAQQELNRREKQDADEKRQAEVMTRLAADKRPDGGEPQ